MWFDNLVSVIQYEALTVKIWVFFIVCGIDTQNHQKRPIIPQK